MNLGRKISGAKYHARRKRRLHEKIGQERKVILGDTKRKSIRVRGGNIKITLLNSDIVNIVTKKGNVQKANIDRKSVV